MLLLPPKTTFLSVALMDEYRKKTPGATSRTSSNFISGILSSARNDVPNSNRTMAQQRILESPKGSVDHVLFVAGRLRAAFHARRAFVFLAHQRDARED